MPAFRVSYKTEPSESSWIKVRNGKLMYSSSPRAVVRGLESGFLTEGEVYKVEELQEPVFGYNDEGEYDGVRAEHEPPRVHYFAVGKPVVKPATAAEAGDGA